LSLLTDVINFENQKWVLREAVEKSGKVITSEVAVEYGELITILINFFLVSLTVLS
jgi:large conductance mechanosensitive channel